MHNAHILSVVLTDRVNINNLSTFQIASLGRHPHTNWLGVLTEHDKQIINTALSDVGIFNLKDRLFSSLSDGEKQRAMVAKALAQDTPLILLDEPTAHLDLPNRVEMMRLLRVITSYSIHYTKLYDNRDADIRRGSPGRWPARQRPDRRKP